MPEMERKFYEIRAASDADAEILIYDEIGQGFFSEGITAKQFVADLEKVQSKQINLRINSPGGSVFDALAIYNALERHPAKVHTYIDGLAASAASFIALAGETITMSEGALFMIHNPWAGISGDAEDMRKAADTLDKVSQSMNAIYMKRWNGTEDELKAALDAETWFSAEEAVAVGFANDVAAVELKIAASYDAAKLGFRNMPMAASENQTTESTDSVETEKKDNMSDLEMTVQVLQDQVAELERSFEASHATEVQGSALSPFKSAGEFVKAVAAGDDNAIRAYAGGTTADAVVMNGWVGDLTRIIEEAAILRGVFGSGSLPSEGNFIEYAQLKSNTLDVDVQADEGDDLAFGLVAQEIKTAPVKTLGGYSTLSRQEIDRSSVNILDVTLRGMAAQTGKALNAQMRTAYEAEVAAQITAGNTVEVPATGATYADWLDAIVDASVKFQALNLSISALVVDTATFKALTALEGTDGRPVLLVQGNGVNNVGTIDVRGLAGSLASVPVVLDPALSAGKVAFVNSAAITMYGSPAVRLQDENIINLSKDYSVYTYVATAVEIPSAIVPVEFV